MVEPDVVGGRRRVGLVGFGAIGRAVAGVLRAGEIDGAALAAVLVRDLERYREDAASYVKASITFTDDVDAFFAAGGLDAGGRAGAGDGGDDHADEAGGLVARDAGGGSGGFGCFDR